MFVAHGGQVEDGVEKSDIFLGDVKSRLNDAVGVLKGRRENTLGCFLADPEEFGGCSAEAGDGLVKKRLECGVDRQR